jgi:hypothetical protein
VLTGTRPSIVSQSPMFGDPMWLLSGEPVATDADEGERWGVLAPELHLKERLDEAEEDGLKAVLRRRRPEVLREEGANGWNREDMISFC